jgi:hypothetical protein
MKIKMEPQELYKLIMKASGETLKRKGRTDGDYITLKGVKRSKDDDGEIKTEKYCKTIPLEDLTFDNAAW